MGDPLKDVQIAGENKNVRENLSPLKKATLAINRMDNTNKSKYSTRSVARERMDSQRTIENRRKIQENDGKEEATMRKSKTKVINLHGLKNMTLKLELEKISIVMEM